MPWSLDYHSPEDRDLLDEFCLSVGRALCLASNFESKCRHIYWLISLVDGVQAGNDFDGATALVETLKIDSKPLQRVIDVLGKRGTRLADDVDTLMNAKNSRNFIAHKAGGIGPMSSASASHLVKMASALFPHVVNVAAGDNLVSSWLYEIGEICRLTDPATIGKRRNHGLPLFVELVKQSDKALGDDMGAALEGIVQQTDPFRKRRNRAIAHSDLKTKLNIGDEVLPGVSREMVSLILRAFGDLMNLYEDARAETTTLYEEVIPALGSDGDFLAEQLRRAIAFRDLEREDKLDRALWVKGRYQEA